MLSIMGRQSNDYRDIHRWMNRHYPRIGRCEWCGGTDRKTQYANVGHRYTRNRADWFEFCCRCHAIFDGVPVALTDRRFSAESRAKMSAGAKLRSLETRMTKLTEEDVIAIRLTKGLEMVTNQQLAYRYNVSRVCISDVVNYKTWKPEATTGD